MPSMRRRTLRAHRAASLRRRDGSSSTRRPCSSTATRRCPISSTPRQRLGRSAEPKARFPLLLTCAKPTLFLQSQNRALASLRKRSMFPEVEIHPEAARERRISQGDWVSITTAHGSVRACARFNETLDPRVVVGQHGWWQGCAELDAPGYDPFGPIGANYNLLIDATVGTRSAAPHPTAPTCARFGQSASRDGTRGGSTARQYRKALLPLLWRRLLARRGMRGRCI